MGAEQSRVPPPSSSSFSPNAPAAITNEASSSIRLKKNSTCFCGLTNFGSTCYFNAVIIALFASPTFRKLVLRASPDDITDELAHSFQSLYWDMLTTRSSSLSPRDLFGRLNKLRPEWTIYQQQDAHELLNFLLNHMEEKTNGGRAASQKSSESSPEKKKRGHHPPPQLDSEISQLLTDDDPSELSSGLDARTRVLTSPPYPKSPVFLPVSGGGTLGGHQVRADLDFVSLFEGFIAHKTRCLACDHTSFRVERFFDLPIDLGKDLDEALQNLERNEFMRATEKYNCGKCQIPQPAVRSCQLYHIPKILVFQMKRFRYDSRSRSLSKINDVCKFGLDLSIKTPSGSETFFRNFGLAEALKRVQKFLTTAGWPTELVSMQQQQQQQFQYHASSSLHDCLEQEAEEAGQNRTGLKLFAIICHIGGSMFAGHYITIVRQSAFGAPGGLGLSGHSKLRDSDWCLVDDDEVTPLTANQMSAFLSGQRDGSVGGSLLDIGNAYLILYEKVDEPTKK